MSHAAGPVARAHRDVVDALFGGHDRGDSSSSTDPSSDSLSVYSQSSGLTGLQPLSPAAVYQAPHSLLGPSRAAARARIESLLAPFASGPNATRRQLDIVPQAGHGPSVRLSNAVAAGSFNRVHLGVDEAGQRSVWRQMRVQRGGTALRGETPYPQLYRELLVMAEVNSPLLPMRAYLDPNNNYITEVRHYTSDVSNLMPHLLPASSLFAVPFAEAERATLAAIAIGKQVLAQLAVLHESGWLHRDIKPDNILFSNESGAVLADYGLAHEVDLHGETHGRNGTSTYMAPEVTGGSGLVPMSQTGSDVFAVAVSLAEIATGGRIFSLPLFSGSSASRYQALIAAQAQWAQHGPVVAVPAAIATAASAYNYIAQSQPAFASLLFVEAMAVDPRARPPVTTFLRRLNDIMPDGGELHGRAWAWLDEATAALSMYRDPVTHPDRMFAELEARPLSA